MLKMMVKTNETSRKWSETIGNDRVQTKRGSMDRQGFIVLFQIDVERCSQ